MELLMLVIFLITLTLFAAKNHILNDLMT